MNNIHKIENGQFYTVKNPFQHILVKEWFSLVDQPSTKTFIEPFAGANHLVKQFLEIFPEISVNQWKSYDIEPEKITNNQLPAISIIFNDSLQNPPSGDVAITNPPYLAKNSATRKKLTKIDFKNFQDLYEVSIDSMLKHNDYVAAIIPESFITKKLFTERLYGVISITDQLFDDTDFPVCLALWTPETQSDYQIYVGNTYIGKFKEILHNTHIFQTTINKGISIKFNDPQGILGLTAIDNNYCNSIEFKKGDVFPSSLIKNTSRSFTRISVKNSLNENIINEKNLNQTIIVLNNILEQYRAETSDIFLTSFKNIRKDGKYRRRLDWKTASLIIHYYLNEINYQNNHIEENSFNLFNID